MLLLGFNANTWNSVPFMHFLHDPCNKARQLENSKFLQEKTNLKSVLKNYDNVDIMIYRSSQIPLVLFFQYVKALYLQKQLFYVSVF
jgi:hypothetical protein